MSQLSRNELLMYAACAGATIWGLALAFGVSGGGEPAEAAGSGDEPAAEFDRAPTGVRYDPVTGVTGISQPQQGNERKSQVQLLTNEFSKTVRPRKRPETDPLFEAQREMRGGDERLREVLEQMGGEPVWVEGLDGPAPEDE